MRVIHSLREAALSQPCHVTIGAFDGVHRGHQQLVGSMVRTAHEAGRMAAAVTFDPHPGALLGRRPLASLSTIDERVELLAGLGLDLLAVLSFTSAVSGTPAVRFVDTLRQQLGMVELWAGPDFALGHRRAGDVPFLQKLGRQAGFTVRVVEPLQWRDKPVNSTRIRAALTAGDVDEANGCLGRPYRLAGTIVRGRGLGHTLGVPTANLEPPPERLIPANGVYACHARTSEGSIWMAVANVGVRPTIGADQLTLEAHLLDFEGDLYEQRLALDFVARLRDEKTFPSLNALVAQMHEDIAHARDILASSAAAD